MDLYIVDGNFLKTTIVDVFNSLVWTERYNASGEVILTVPDNVDTRAMITEGIFLSIPESKEIMLVDTILLEQGTLTATGKSLVEFLKERMFRASWSSAKTAWGLGVNVRTASYIANYVMTHTVSTTAFIADGTVLTAAQGTNEVIAKITNSAEVSGPTFDMTVPYGNVYDAIKTVCDADDLGFTLYPPSVIDGTGNLLFKTYRGLDRSTTQSVNGQVIFEPALDSLTDIKELRSISGYKNVAWVFPNGATAQSQVGVASTHSGTTLTGWQRRTLMVDASDINVADYTAAELQIALTRRGLDALINNNYVHVVDGQVAPQAAFTYGVDYNLGDIIELRGTTNFTQKARISEYIRAQDSSGERSYPTLSVI